MAARKSIRPVRGVIPRTRVVVPKKTHINNVNLVALEKEALDACLKVDLNDEASIRECVVKSIFWARHVTADDSY